MREPVTYSWRVTFEMRVACCVLACTGVISLEYACTELESVLRGVIENIVNPFFEFVLNVQMDLYSAGLVSSYIKISY